MRTATVCPPSAMTHTAGGGRRRTAAGLRLFLKNGEPVAAASSATRGARSTTSARTPGGAGRAAKGGAVGHFVSFTDDEVDASKGKGHAEHRAIRPGSSARPIAGAGFYGALRARRIVKITGRWSAFVEGLDAVLDAVDAGLVVQSTPRPGPSAMEFYGASGRLRRVFATRCWAATYTSW